MKLSTLFLAGTFAVLSTGAFAAEVTHPFYVPEQGKFLTDTNYSYTKVDVKHLGDMAAQNLSEEISFGVAQGLAIRLSGSNTWLRVNPDDAKSDKEDRNLAWKVGATYNILDTGSAFFQAKLGYGQAENRAVVGEYKAVDLALKGGYDFGYVLPYLQAGAEFPVMQSKYSDDDPQYNVYAALYKAFGPVALDGGVSYVHNKNGSLSNWALNARADYLLTPSMSVGLFGSYSLDGKGAEKVEYDQYTVGLNFKAAF